MKTAVITSFDKPPRYEDVAEPVPNGPEEMLVDVLAVGLHHLTRGTASGAHYPSTAALPLVPGADGTLRYFGQGPGQMGAMADKAAIRLDHSVEIPNDCDPAAVAAAINPGMSAWPALRCRFPFQLGRKILILGPREVREEWPHIGSMGGDVAGIPGAFLRAANFQILGSGNGSVSMRHLVAELPALVKKIASGTFRIDAKAVPLSHVAQVWAEPAHAGERVVFTP